jgi:hypothetical protein
MKKLLCLFLGLFLCSITSLCAQDLNETEAKHRFRFGVNYTTSYRFTKVSDGLNLAEREYQKGLKFGVGYLFSFNYYRKKYGGIGLQVMNYYSSGTLANVSVVTSPGQTTKITKSDNISIQYVGLSYGYKTAISQDKKWFVTGDIGLGYNTYQNTAIALDTQKIRARTLGLNTIVGLDYKIAENLCIGIAGNFILARTGTYEYDNGIEKKTVTLPNNAKDSYSRAQISIGMRFVIE